MALAFRNTKDKIRSFLSVVERFFLGPTAPLKGKKCTYQVGCKQQYLSDGFLVNIDEGFDETPLSSLEIFPVDKNEYPVVIVVTAVPVDHCKNMAYGKNSPLYFLLPDHLEAIDTMLELFLKNLKSIDVLIILWNISRIPSKHEIKVSYMTHDTQMQHGDAVYNLLKKSILLKSKYNVDTVVIDHEDLMGKKNSAFIRRLFPK